MPISTITRRSLMRAAAAVPLGAVFSPAIIGRARAAATRMRISSSQQNDPKFANGRVYFDNLQKQVKAANLKAAADTRTHGMTVEGEAKKVLQERGVAINDVDKDAFRKRVAVQTENFIKQRPESKDFIETIKSTRA